MVKSYYTKLLLASFLLLTGLTQATYSQTVSFSGTLTAFQSCAGGVSFPQPINVSATVPSGNASVIITAPTGFEVAAFSASGFYGPTTNMSAGSSSINSTIYVRLAAGASGTVSGNLVATCSSASTNRAVSGTVDPVPINGNTITGTQTICIGSQATPITGGTATDGVGGFTYLWESNVSASYGTAPGVSNALDYAPGDLFQTTTYRRKVISGPCINISSPVTVTVQNRLTNNTFSSAQQSFCMSGSPTAITGNNAGATSYKWLMSEAGIDSGYVDAPGTNNAQNYTPPASVIKKSVWFKRVATTNRIGVCGIDTSFSGKRGHAIRYGVGSVSIEGGVPAALQGNTTKFVGMWIYNLSSNPATSDQGLFSMAYTETCNTTLRFMLFRGGKLGVETQCANATSGITVPYGKWVYVFMEYTPANKCAVGMVNENGTITREVLTSIPNAVNQIAGYMEIGINNSSGQTFAGSIDEVSLWSVIPSNTNIVSMSNNGLTGSETGLEGYWAFDEGPGNTSIADKSPYKRNGSTVNMNSSTWGGVGILSASVLPPITSNSVSNAQTICANTQADTIRGSQLSGGNGIYTYQWQVSTTNAQSGYSNTLSTKDLKYPSNITANTWFRRIALSGGCRDTSSLAVRPGSALTFIGDSSSYVNITAGVPLAFQGDSAKTVSMWVYPTTSNGALFTMGSTGNCQSTLRFELSNGKLHIDEGCAAATSNITVPLNEWTYVFARYSTSSKFTVGKIEAGVVVSENLTGLPAAMIQESGLMRIGGNTITNRYFTGKIDEVSIWDTTLSDEDISFFSYRGSTFSGIAPAGFWNLNAGTGTAIADNSGKGLAGTLVNLTPAKAWVGGGLAISVIPRIGSNTISAAQEVCRGSVPAALTGALPTNITAPLYQWLVSTTSATSGFAPIGTNDTSRNYTPTAALTQDLWYRRVVYTQSICPNDTSAAIKLTVTDIITAGTNTVSATSGLCNTPAGMLLTASTPTGGNGTAYTYNWIFSSTGPASGFSAAPGTNNVKEYTVPGTVTQTGWYKRRVLSGGCAADTSAEIIKVFARLQSNTAGTSQAVCYNTPLTLGSTATGGDGTPYTYQWLKSTISADSGFTVLSISDTSRTYTSSFTQQTWLKRTVSSGICPTDTSVAVRIAVAPEVTDQVISAPAMMCAGDSNPVTLDGSLIDYDYVLRDNSNNTELATVPGTGSAIGFPKLISTKGLTYNVLARRASMLDGAGFAADFNGSYHLESYNRIVNTDNITFESWVYLRPGSGTRFLMYNGQPGYDGYGIYIDGGSKICLLLGYVTYYYSNVTVPTNTWTHVGFVRRAGTWIIYVNGEPMQTLGNATPNVARFDFIIGAAGYGGADRFNGYLDEMRFWTVARTDEEILANYKRRLGAGGGLLRNYRFDNGSGTTVTDAIGNATMDVSYQGNIVWVRGLGTTSCSKQMPGTVTIGVDSTKIVNKISAAQAICSGNTPARLNAPVSTYGSYAWLKSIASDSSGFTPVTVPTTDSTYTPAPLTQDTWIKRIATSALCGVDTSLSVKLAIAMEAADQTVAPIDSPTCRTGSYIITLNGSEPDYEYQLRNNNTNTTVTTLKGTGSALTFPVNNLTTTTTYNVLGRTNHLYPGTGKGLYFDGVTGKKLALPNFTDKDNITIEMWVYDNGGTGSRVLMYNGDPGANGYGLRIEGNRQISVLMGYVVFYTTNVVLPRYQWTHLAVTKTTTSWEIYLNGVAQAVTLTQQPNTPSGGAALGALVSSESVFKGTIDEFRFWTVTRTAAQIAASYNKYLPGNTPGLKYNYRFDEGTGTIARNDGATANATLTSMTPATAWVDGFGVASCLKEMTGTITLRIDTAVANNNITSLPQTICNGTTPAVINGSAPRGGDKLSYTYKWLSSTTGASSGFSAIATSDVKDYQPAALSANTWYKRVVTSGVCAVPDTSAAIKITAQDTTKPVVLSQHITAYLNAAGMVSITGAQVDNGSTDTCGIASYSVAPNSFGTTNIGANAVTLTVTDNNGNSASTSATVTVMDTVSPVVTPQNITAYLNASGYVTVAASQINNGSADAAGIASISISPDSFTCANAGANTVTLTVTDNNGNSSSAHATVTVQDTIKPTATAQHITAYLNAAGAVSITASQINNGSADVCGIATMSVLPNSFTCANVGTNTITLTVTDNTGNSSTATATVTIQDTIKPIAAAQNITAYLNAAGTVSITASQVNNGSADACGIATLSVSPDSFTCVNVGANTVTLTVTDNNGNSKTATATVTVQDTIKPTATTQNITTYLNATGTASITAAQINNGSADACGIATVSVSPNSFTCTHVGANTVTLTVTDNNGNVQTATATVTVADSIKPVAIAQNITAYLSSAGTVSITGTQVNNASTDGCGIATVSVSPNSFTCANVGANTVTLTATDNNGNASTATATVTILDTIKPTATAQNITAYLNAAGMVSITAAQVNNGSADACGIATMSVSPNSFTCANAGANTVTLTVTDNNGNSKTATATVTVSDTISPVAVAQNITAYLSAAGTASITAAQINNGSADACGIATVSVSPNSFTCANVGANTVTLTVTDNNGNSKTTTATVTIQDTIKPTATAQNITTYLSAAGTVSITASQVNNGSADACGIATMSVSPNSFTCANVGANTVTLTITDNNGNSRTATATVTVQDTIKPAATAQNITAYLTAAGTVSITAAQVNNGSGGTCGIAGMSVSPNSFTCANVGANTVTLTITDVSGNSSTATATVTVQDTVKPTATAQNLTAYLNAAGTVSINASQVNNGSSDACGIANLSVSPNSFTCANVGANTVTLTVTDNNGNSKTASATVTVSDTIRPVATAQNITAYLNAAGTASITGSQVNNGSTDACGIATVSVSPNSFTCANVGANTVILTVTDNNGNSKTATATVTVQDTIKPVATAQSLTAYLDITGTINITASQVNNGSTDACGIATMSISPNSFTCANVGANTVTLNVTDNNGNSKTATATVTVQDTIKPTATAQNITAYLNAAGTVSITASQVNNGSSDACGIATLSVSPNSFTCANVGANTVTLTVTDNNGNSKTATATVSVQDTIRPVATAQNITAYLNAAGTASVTGSQVNNGSTDACGIATLSVSPNSFTCANVGANTVTVTVTDNNGNSKTAAATVTVQDTIKPTATAQNITAYLNATGTVSITASQVNNGSTDACGIATLSVSPSSFTCANVGANTVTLTVTDNNGNVKTATATVTVSDTIRPVATAQNITAYLNAAGTVSVTGAQINNGSTDACGIATLSVSPSSFTCANVGANTVTLTVTDNNGNVKTATATVTVSDTIRPVATAQNITAYLNAAGTISITGTQVNNGSTDACGIATVSVSPNSFTCASVGANTVTLTVTDNNGNSKTASATVTVQDTIKPTATAQNITAYLNATGTASITASQVNNGSTDACGIATLSVSPNSFTCANVGANTVTLTITDNNGNSKTASVTVTVQDTIKPTATAQNITAYLSTAGTASITASQVNNGSTDACGIATTSLSQSAFTCANLGANTVTLTVTDNNGNSQAATAAVTVLDTISPVILCKADTIVLDATGHAYTSAARITQSATDNCAIKTMTVSKANFDSTNTGINYVTLTVTDSSGNTTTCNTTVTVIESNPVAICRNIHVYLNASGTASITADDIDGGSSSYIGIASKQVSKSTFGCADLGTNQVTLKIFNTYNKSDSCQATVTVMDTIRPVVLGKNITVYLDQWGTDTITAADLNNGTSDNCVFNLAASRTAFDCSHAGNNLITLRATDAAGNTDSVNVTVTVLDTIRPVIRLKNNVVLYLSATGSTSITPATINNASSDNCGIDSITVSKTNFTCADLGMQQVTLTIKDKNGNTDSASTNIVITDPIAPVARPKANVIVYLSSSGQSVINPSIVDSASSDNCTITNRTLSQSVFTCAQIGSNTITFTVQDQSGNSSFTNTNIEVRDTTRPNVVVSNRTLYLNASGTATVTAAGVNNNSSDNCGIDSVWIGKTTFGCADLGNNTVALHARDVNGNTNSAHVLITVFDTIKPLIRVKQNLLVYLDASGSASITSAMADSASSDNCMLASLQLSKATFDCANVGVNTISLSGTDASNNTGSATFTVTVRDTIKPTLTTTPTTLYLDATGSVMLSAAQVTGTRGDNCSAPAITLSKTTFNCSNKGVNTVTVTATDTSGNQVTASATVTVLDTVKPQVYTNNSTVYLNQAGNATITAAQVNNNSTDNCAITGYTLSKTTFTESDLGTNQVTLSATDASANAGSAQATITVLDSIKPTAVTRNLLVYLDATGSATITPAQVNNGSSDNTTITDYSLSKTTFGCADTGSNTVVLSVTDISSNTGKANATITVRDTIKPTVTAQSITVYLNALGTATVTAGQLNNSSTDNCATVVLHASQTAFTCTNLGTNAVTLTATDASGNSTSSSATVTVLDTIKPNVVVNNNLSVYLDATGSVTLTAAQVNNGSTDNCGIASISLGKTSFSGIDLGLNIIGFSVTDASGNVNMVNINVTVLDTTRPVVKGTSKTIYLNPGGMASIAANEIDNGSTDNTGISFVGLSKYNFSCSDLGANTIQLSVTDVSNNTSYASVTITVLDTIKPVLLNAPADLSFGLCGRKVNYTLPQITDNCGTLRVEQTGGIATGGTYPVGVTTNTFKISDVSGNSIMVSFRVTIYPSYLPVMFANLEMCSNAASVDLSQGRDSLVFTGSGVGTDLKTFNPMVAGAGNHVVSYTFTDSSGCEVEGFFFITVNAGPLKPVLVRTTSTTLTVRDKYDHYQWYKDNELLVGETGQTLTVVRAGVYKVMVTTERQCASMSDPIGIGVPTPVTGLEETGERISFKVYPNPSLGRFVIEKNATAKGHTTISITDVLGKEVYRQVTADDVIDMDLSGVAAGAYYIRLQNGESSTIKPIVIKN